MKKVYKEIEAFLLSHKLMRTLILIGIAIQIITQSTSSILDLIEKIINLIKLIKTM